MTELLSLTLSNNKKENIPWIVATAENVIINNVCINLDNLTKFKRALINTLLYTFEHYLDSNITIKIYTGFYKKKPILLTEFNFRCINSTIISKDIISIKENVSEFRYFTIKNDQNQFVIAYINEL